MADGNVVWALTCLAAGMLVIAGLPKLAGRASVPLLPTIAHRPLGALEMLVGGWALLVPSPASAAAVSVTYALLSVTLAVAIARREPDCGCFGVEPVRPAWGHFVVNVVLMVASAAAIVSSWHRPATGAWLLTVGVSLVGAAMLAELLSTGAEVRRLRTSLEAKR